jgi:hypothetical protein
MKTKIFFLSIILLLLSANVFAQKQAAAAQVEAFYKFHRAGSGVFNARGVNSHKRWFTAELNRLFQNELKREKEFLKQNPTDKPHFGDGFPFLPYEECSSGGKLVKNVLKIGPETIRKGVAVVEVKIFQPKQCGGELTDTYKVELVKIKSVWLINDWIYSDGKRLSEDLKRSEY